MTMQRSLLRAVPAALLAGAVLAPSAFAQQGQQIFQWSGRVDREREIVIRNNQVSTRNIGNTEPGRTREEMISRLPRQDGQLMIERLNGRGDVDVVQQPSAQNNYTAIVRIRDNASGSDNYRIAGYWQSYANGDVYGNGNNRDVYGNNGNGRGRGRGRYDRGDIDSRDRDRERGVYNNGANQQALHWSGNVDGELEIRIQNGRMSYRNLSGQSPTGLRADVANLSIPRNGAILSIVQNQGRGSVTVVQQPTQYNGNTAVIRVRDPQGGYGFYDFNLLWQ